MTPFEAYSRFMAMRNHFDSEDYDYFKYLGKVKATETSFENRRDRLQYAKLARIEKFHHLLVSHAVDKQLKWVGELLTPEADEVRLAWEKRIESLTYNYTNDIKKIDFKKDLHTDGQHPTLLTMYLRKEIYPETLVILNEILIFIPDWDKRITEKYVWPAISLKLRKYRPCLTFDVERFKKITLDFISQIK